MIARHEVEPERVRGSWRCALCWQAIHERVVNFDTVWRHNPARKRR
jgi:hypothetical protein